MIFIPNYHWNHTKFEFGMFPVVIWYEYHTSVFAVIYAEQLATQLYNSYNLVAIATVLVKLLKQQDIASYKLQLIGVWCGYYGITEVFSGGYSYM